MLSPSNLLASVSYSSGPQATIGGVTSDPKDNLDRSKTSIKSSDFASPGSSPPPPPAGLSLSREDDPERVEKLRQEFRQHQRSKSRSPSVLTFVAGGGRESGGGGGGGGESGGDGEGVGEGVGGKGGKEVNTSRTSVGTSQGSLSPINAVKRQQKGLPGQNSPSSPSSYPLSLTATPFRSPQPQITHRPRLESDIL